MSLIFVQLAPIERSPWTTHKHPDHKPLFLKVIPFFRPISISCFRPSVGPCPAVCFKPSGRTHDSLRLPLQSYEYPLAHVDPGRVKVARIFSKRNRPADHPWSIPLLPPSNLSCAGRIVVKRQKNSLASLQVSSVSESGRA